MPTKQEKVFRRVDPCNITPIPVERMSWCRNAGINKIRALQWGTVCIRRREDLKHHEPDHLHQLPWFRHSVLGSPLPFRSPGRLEI